jgi:hypothetical protein
MTEDGWVKGSEYTVTQSQIQLLYSWIIITIITFLDVIHRLVFCLKYRPVYISKHVSETGNRASLQLPVYWTHLSRVHLRTEIEFRLRTVVLKYKLDNILDKRRDDG